MSYSAFYFIPKFDSNRNFFVLVTSLIKLRAFQTVHSLILYQNTLASLCATWKSVHTVSTTRIRAVRDSGAFFLSTVGYIPFKITNTYISPVNICNNLLINCSGTKSVAELMLYKLWTFIFEFLINFHPPTPPLKNPLPQMFGKFIANVCVFIRMSANLRHLNLNVCIVGERGKLGSLPV